MQKNPDQVPRLMHTASQVLQVSVDDDVKTLVDGGDECGETMPWFTRGVRFTEFTTTQII